MNGISFKNARKFLFLLALILTVLLSACSAQDWQPLSFQPQLFTRQNQNNGNKECFLLVGGVDVSFSEQNPSDAILKVNGSMSAACSNLQVGMDQPDITKNIQINLAADTSQASGGTDRPFTIELVAKSLRYGRYTVWVNGVAETMFSVN